MPLHPATAPVDLDKIEARLLDAEPVDIPVEHTFTAGLYVRTAKMPAGALVIGHRHRDETLNFLMQGRLLVIVNGERKEMAAPCILPSAAGTRKAAYILEDVIWTNVHPNPDNETDLLKLEERYIEKSAAFLEFERNEMAQLQAAVAQPEELLCHG